MGILNQPSCIEPGIHPNKNSNFQFFVLFQFFPDQVYPVEIEKGAWFVAVARDAVVPTMNSDNPFASSIKSTGCTREILTGIWITGSIKTWHEAVGTVVPKKKTGEIHVYTRSDACGAAGTWAEYLGKSQEDLGGVGVYGDPGLAEAVRRDALGIGYNNINYAYDSKTRLPVAGITAVPIDTDGNGRIDEKEDFYGNLDMIVAAIADGRYPSPPVRDLYLVSRGKPVRPEVVAFLGWALTEGQKWADETGYVKLPDEQLQSQLGRLR